MIKKNKTASYFLAVSPVKKGVYRFDTEEGRTEWCKSTPGGTFFAQDQVPPSLLANIEAGN